MQVNGVAIIKTLILIKYTFASTDAIYPSIRSHTHRHTRRTLLLDGGGEFDALQHGKSMHGTVVKMPYYIFRCLFWHTIYAELNTRVNQFYCLIKRFMSTAFWCDEVIQ